MTAASAPSCTLFAGHRRLAEGDLVTVALAARGALERGERAALLAFEDATARQVELDLRGSAAEVKARHAARLAQPVAPGADGAAPAGAPPAEPRGPGRPRLGVVAREVTLLPRHWEWLAAQPGGASVALRRLVEEARRLGGGRDRVRRAQEVAYRLMTSLAGDLPGYEEATRALFAGQGERFEALTAAWPPDVGAYARRLAAGAFPAA
ncbi:MAG: DUF2239 family protein [Anaeromyxobacter sp.]|nr:DUF2239 family protein [Anaeromyxobacter sp.]MBL0275220.1 DUF2239 family protein [Anaeromyxobacter sp.]